MMTPQQRQAILNSPTMNKLTSSVATTDYKTKNQAYRDKYLTPQAPTPQVEPVEAPRSKGSQRLTGIRKGLGEEAVETGKLLEMSKRAKSPLTGALGMAGQLASKVTGRDLKFGARDTLLGKGQSMLEERLGKEEGELFKAETPIERRAKFGTQVATAFAPTPGGKGSLARQTGKLAKKELRKVGEKVVKKRGREALDLSADELKKVDKRSLKFLSKEGMEMTETKGGLFRGEEYKMTKQVKKLQDEFKYLFKSRNPHKNLKSAQKEGLSLDKVSDKIVGKYNKMMNEKVLRNKLQKVLNQDLTTSYGGSYEKKDVAKKAIDSLINKIKTGDLKGLNKARKQWRGETAKDSGKLSEAKDVLHKAIQEIIESELPEASKKIYKSNRTKMAKLFDVRKILRAKKETRMGKAKVKEIIKKVTPYAMVATGATALGRKLKRLYGQDFRKTIKSNT